MKYTISLHAKERMVHRRISLDVIADVIAEPDHKLQDRKCLWIFQKKIKNEDKMYLYRVYLNTCKDPAMVITAYKTSKIEKYGY